MAKAPQRCTSFAELVSTLRLGPPLGWPVNDLPCQRSSMLLVVDGHDAVDDDVLDSHRELVWLFERRAIDHVVLIEDRDVGGEPLL